MATINSLHTFFLLVPLLVTLADGGPADTSAAFLNPQNAVRDSLSLPRLRWSSQLASYAKQYANQRRGDCKLIHSDSNYGENIFWGKGRQWSISDAVGAWTVQRNYYDYGRNWCMPNRDCTHYTQIVWRTTQQVGCAKVVCNSGDTFIACEYYPHGNIIGQRPY